MLEFISTTNLETPMRADRPLSPLSPLSRLPTEIVIYIFELAAANSKPTAASLALTCRLVHQWVEPILYRTVVLHSKAQNDLFERTLRSKEPEFFHKNLKHFAPAAGHAHPTACPYTFGDGKETDAGYQVGAGGNWHVIKGVRALMMSASCQPTDEKTGYARPNEVAIRGYVKPRFFSYPAFENVTHLFLCDVPMLFTSVLTQVLEALPFLPSLTHLACPFSNKWRGEQHNIFAEVCILLQLPPFDSASHQPVIPPTPGFRPAPLPTTNGYFRTPRGTETPLAPVRKPFEMLLLNVWHFQEPDLERESYIWAQLAPIEDKRLFLQPGEAFSVKKWEECATSSDVGGPGSGTDVWEQARRSAEGWRSWVR